jgi:hypothetical protein
MEADAVREVVRKAYGEIANGQTKGGCCGPGSSCGCSTQTSRALIGAVKSGSSRHRPARENGDMTKIGAEPAALPGDDADAPACCELTHYNVCCEPDAKAGCCDVDTAPGVCGCNNTAS